MITAQDTLTKLNNGSFQKTDAEQILRDSSQANSPVTGAAAHPEQHVVGAGADGAGGNMDLGLAYQVRLAHSQFSDMDQAATVLMRVLKTAAGNDAVRGLINGLGHNHLRRNTIHLDTRAWVGGIGPGSMASMAALPFSGADFTISAIVLIIEAALDGRIHIQTFYPVAFEDSKLFKRCKGYDGVVVVQQKSAAPVAPGAKNPLTVMGSALYVGGELARQIKGDATAQGTA